MNTAAQSLLFLYQLVVAGTVNIQFLIHNANGIAKLYHSITVSTSSIAMSQLCPERTPPPPPPPPSQTFLARQNIHFSPWWTVQGERFLQNFIVPVNVGVVWEPTIGSGLVFAKEQGGSRARDRPPPPPTTH